jgi:hypothetical protein
MDWRQIAESWKQLMAKVAFLHSPAREIASQADRSIRAAPCGGDENEEGRMAPYIPDNDTERNDFSLHLSC